MLDIAGGVLTLGIHNWDLELLWFKWCLWWNWLHELALGHHALGAWSWRRRLPDILSCYRLLLVISLCLLGSHYCLINYE